MGPATVTPALHAMYVSAEGALFDTAAPVKDRYFELRPQVGAEVPVNTGFLRGAYRAHIRRGSAFELVNTTTTHLADLSVELPLGARQVTRGVAKNLDGISVVDEPKHGLRVLSPQLGRVLGSVTEYRHLVLLLTARSP